MLITTKQMYEHCYGKYALAAVNVAFMEQVLALFAAASEASSPVIVQTTPFQRSYAGQEMLIGMMQAASQIYPDVVYAAHIDHGDEENVHDAIESGFYTSVMIDASHDAFHTNVERTRAVVQKAGLKGISVEAELGVLSGVEDNMTIQEEKAFYTDPEQVEEFVGKTGCDSLAIAVGTSHGAYKFSGGQGLQFHILEDIQQRLPGFPLVLHGGSAVNYEEIDRINKAGGRLKPTAKGVDPGEVQRSIQFGICKVNLATDLRLLWTRVVREFFHLNPHEFRPTSPGTIYMEEYKKTMINKFELFSSIDKANSLKEHILSQSS